LKHTFPQVDLEFTKIEEIINDCYVMGIKSIIISGGEPLLHKDIYDILKMIKGYGISISLITSLAVKCDIARILENVSRINVSYDADNEDVYKRTRGIGELHQVKAGLSEISSMIKSYSAQFNIWTVLSKMNEDNIDDIKKYISSLNVTKHTIYGVKTWDKLKAEKHIVKGTAGWVDKCWYTFINFIIDATGNVMTCCKLLHDNSDYKTINKDFILVNVNEERLYNIWNSDISKAKRLNIFNNRSIECADCDRGIKINEELCNYIKNRDITNKEIFL
jgi:MoaA/NifB/PqqE/SkfB family radical SAM enzyme